MAGPEFDAAAIRALASLLTETGLSEIEISEGEKRIRVARQLASSNAPALPPNLAPAPLSAATAPPAEDMTAHPGAVLSPMVGIAYLSPEPGAPSFVTPGQQVEAGQTLLLIEAMKTFNQIKAPKSGAVVHVLVAPGAPVEFGEVLMIIE